MEPNKLITITQAAKMLDLHRNSVVRWVRDGKVKTVVEPISGWTVIDTEDLLRFNKERKASKGVNHE